MLKHQTSNHLIKASNYRLARLSATKIRFQPDEKQTETQLIERKKEEISKEIERWATAEIVS